MLLKRKISEYKKIVGKHVDHHLLKNILHSIVDAASKQHIVDWKLGKPKMNEKGEQVSMHTTFCEDIDSRYKLEYGTLHDDPMGLHAVGEQQAGQAVPNTAAAAGGERLGTDGNCRYAFGKGGKPDDGKCRICNGESHFARD